MGHKLVCPDTDRRAIGIDVSVEIDEAWRHELPGGVEHAQSAGRGNFGLERFDNPVADPDIARASERLAWIEHLAAFDHQIELVVWSHDGTRPTRRSAIRSVHGNRRGPGMSEWPNSGCVGNWLVKYCIWLYTPSQ